MMGPYAKLGVLLIRSVALTMLTYASPIILWDVVRTAVGGHTPPSGTTGANTLAGLMADALAGILLLLLARPLARIAARGLDHAEK
jgi:hypothetical protein